MKTIYTNVVTFDIDSFNFPIDIIKYSRKTIVYHTEHGLHVIAYAKPSKLNTNQANLIYLRDKFQDPKKTKFDNKSKNPNAHKRLFTEKHFIKEIIIESMKDNKKLLQELAKDD